MKVRQDAWTDENDLLLAETVLRHVREGSTQLNAFEEVGDKLNRTSAACGFRWNAVVRHKYEKALQLAKKQRKQRQRLLGKDHGGKKKLLYQPPMPSVEDLEVEVSTELADNIPVPQMEETQEVTTNQPVAQNPASTAAATMPTGIAQLNLSHVIQYLQNLNHSNLQGSVYKSENERLKREMAELRKENAKLEEKVAKLEKDSATMQEDYETLVKIMNRARKLVLFDEEEKGSSTTFKMDRNGNLEKVAE